ncbi:MAG: hypothetical protein HYT16_00840 [DPANN group archaeon]|nr:hypothetical protein [DPANN group archaeon]
MLSMEEFGLYNEVPVALAKAAKFIYLAHSLDLHYNEDGQGLISENAREIIFGGVFEAIRKRFEHDKEQAANSLVWLVRGFGFGDVDTKFDREYLLSEIKRLDNELIACYCSAANRLPNKQDGLEHLLEGLQEAVTKILDGY